MRTRMSGGVGAGRLILPATRLGQVSVIIPVSFKSAIWLEVNIHDRPTPGPTVGPLKVVGLPQIVGADPRVNRGAKYRSDVVRRHTAVQPVKPGERKRRAIELPHRKK